MLYGPSGRQLKLLKGAEKHQMGLYVIWATHPSVIFGQHPISRTQKKPEKQLRACVPCVLDGNTEMLEGSSRLKG